MTNLDSLISSLKAGDEIAAAKLITMIENRGLGREIIPRISEEHTNTLTIGITGPPGVGKSTLTEKLILRLRKDDKKVGVIAIDPSSPFSGGALLGDRIRLQQLTTDPKVFIRSMATRGYLGGISAATLDAAKILEVYGCDYLIIETVGVGQSEIEVVNHVDTTLLVLSPGQGDDIQALKAGVMEIADIFVVNKADRDGVDKTVSEIEMLQRVGKQPDYIPPIVRTIANENNGIEELFEKINAHIAYLKSSHLFEDKRKKRLKFELWHRILATITEKISDSVNDDSFDKMIDELYQKKIDSYSLADNIINKLYK